MTTHDYFDLLHRLDHPCHWGDHLGLPQYSYQTWVNTTCFVSYFDVHFEGARYLLEKHFLDDINFLTDMYFHFEYFEDANNYITSTAFIASLVILAQLLRCLESTFVTYLFTCFAAMLLMLQKLHHY